MLNGFKVSDGVECHMEVKVENQQNMNHDLLKSENDFMEYRIIKLKNGLEAILISDAQNIIDLNALNEELSEESDDELSDTSSEDSSNETGSEKEDSPLKTKGRKAKEKLAACALCVGVGSFSDPPDIPGLAHFLEHMVFMGSAKYPQENGFEEFLKKHGGSDNASTDCERTGFYLECNEKYLREGMDRFAQFFIAPLMISEAMSREREAIHSEFEMSLPSDDHRKEQILGSFAPTNHPAAKFAWGNLTTLQSNIDDNILYKRVHEFQKRHYSAHRMKVAVQGRLSLDTLEEYVTESFSDIPNNNLAPENFTSYVGLYGTSETFNKLVWIKPVENLCQVCLTWVLPSYTREYKSRPLDYVGWLMGHEGEGSILSLLRNKVWALRCDAGNDGSSFEHNSIYSLFSVSLLLTDEGYQNINEIITLVFSYISMLKEKCPSKVIYDELRKICEINFRYKTEADSVTYVEILAESMHRYEPQHYLAGEDLYLEYNPDLTTEILNHLTPDRVNVIIHSTEKSDSFYDKVEPWFGTAYKVEDIPFDWKSSWLNCPSQVEFHLPAPNPYLPTDFSLLKQPEKNPPYPVKILDNNLLEIWYRQDVTFKQPRAYYSFYIISSMFFNILKSNPVNAVLLDILATYLDTKFAEHVYPAINAGLHCRYYSGHKGLFLLFSGYNEKLPLFFTEILKLIYKCCSEINHKNNAKLFNAIKKQKSRSYYNSFLRPKKLMKMALHSVLVETCWTTVEYLAVLHEITPEKLFEFSQVFFRSVKILGLFQGNISQVQSLELCEKFKTILCCSPLEGEKPCPLVTKLDEGELFLKLKSFNESDSNSVITNYYQIGPDNIKTSCLVQLLMMIMEEPLFDNLRTKQQIGYMVQNELSNLFGILAFSITIAFQSSKFTADEVDNRIETFLKNFLKTLKSMSEEEWEETKSSLCSLLSCADLEIGEEVSRNFSEICSDECLFDRPKRKVETIPEISHTELCAWFEDHIASGKKFKKFSVQVLGKMVSTPVSTCNKDNFNGNAFRLTPMASENKKLCVTDIEAYKNTRKFYPSKCSS